MGNYSSSTSAQGESRQESGSDEVIPASQSSSKLTKTKPYHVFINHRGCDVKHTIASTIYYALQSHGFRAFLDAEELTLGEAITEELNEAIRNAALHIAIFSENYAESPWCLEELYLMVKTGTKIIPVFYHVQPSDLRRVAKGLYAPAFSKHEKKKRYPEKKLEEWKGALKAVSNLMGYSLNSANADEGKLLKEIVDYCKQNMEKVPELEPNPERDQVFHSKPVPTELNGGPFSMGIFGGGGGDSWDDGTHSGIRQIAVTFGSVVDSIRVQYDENGSPKWSERHGGTAGPETETVKFDFPNEVLMSISGQYGQKWNHELRAVKCLTFHTNLRKYGPFGNHGRFIKGKTEERIDFVTPSHGCKILGFYGRRGIYLDAIGVHWKPVSTELNGGHFSMGMFGGGGGGCWDDGIYSGIRQIVLTIGTVVDSMTVKYDQDGSPEWSECHGGTDSHKTEKVEFDFPNEVLMSISGQYGRKWNNDMKVVKCISFHTNLKKYGPFGNYDLLIDGKVEERIDFVTPSYGCKILGFYGKSGSHLDAIGVHLKWTTH